MSRIKRRGPSPAIVIAVLALIAAVAGTAVAGPVATTSKLDKKERKQVKKIAKKQAKKQIKKAAPSLSVASAKTADSADKLDGKDASELQTSSGFAQRTSALALTSTLQDVVTTSVTTTGTRIVATASLQVDGTGGTRSARCQLRIAGTASPLYNHDITVTGLGQDLQTMALTFARTVSPGTHAVELRCNEFNGNVSVQFAGLSAVAVGE